MTRTSTAVSLSIVETNFAPSAYVTVPAGARLRLDSMAMKLRPLQATFSGSFLTAAKLAEVGPALDQLIADAKVLRRMVP